MKWYYITHQVDGGDYNSVTVHDILVRIYDTTEPYIYLEDAQASESDGHIEFTVSVRPGLRLTPVQVRYATVDGTAAAGTDYTRQVDTGQNYKLFTIPANRDIGTIRIPIADNQVYGPAKKTFTLQLTNHNNKASLEGDATSLTATGSILDDDPKPVVRVKGPGGQVSYVSEGLTSPVTFTLTLTGRSAADVTVDYATGDARVLSGLAARQGITGATAGEDYTAATGTVTFSPGVTTRQVTVQLTNDDVSEDTEFFGFKISNVQNGQLRNKATEEVADVGLLDDDPRGVTIDPTSIGLDEPASGETAVASSYTVKLNSKPTDTVTVTIGGADPSVTLSGVALGNTNTLTFTTSNWDTAETVTVTPVKDANGIGETITLTHTQSGGDYAGIVADSVTVNVTDSDTRNVVLSPTSLTVTEGDDTGVSYAVKLSTQPSDTVTVTIGGHSGADLSISGATLSNSNTLTFSTSNWNTVQMVTVKAGHDGNSDDESETLTHTASGGDYANLTKDLPVTVTDDAPATVTVSFGAAAYTVAESDDSDTTNVTENTVEVTLTLSADPERTVVIPIEKTNQGGATTADYSGVPQNVTFGSGDTEKTFVFTAETDAVDDDGESVKLSFGALPTTPVTVTAGTTDEATVTITDDDVPSVTVSFGSTAYTVAESDDSDTPDVTENTVEVTVTLSADPERTVVIPIEKTNQGGATTADYSSVPQNVTFDSGDTSESFTFTAETDTVDDDGESVRLSFGATLPDGVSAGTPATSAVSITDDDVPSVTVSFGSAAYTVAESDDSDTTDVTENTVEVTLTLSADPERTVVIPIEKTNQGGATSADYSGVPQNVTFDSGDTEKTFVFTAEADTVDDDGESVKLSFGATLPDGVTAGTPATSAVTITDDDVPSVTVSFGSAAYTVAESDDSGTTDVTENTVEVTLTLSADPERTVVIPIEKTNQGATTADSTADYSGVPQNVTFDSGDTSESFTFTAETDTVDDDGESVKLSFGASLPDGVSAGTTDEATVTITDDDVPSVTVSFGSAAYTVAESDDSDTTDVTENTVEVTLTLSADPERTVVIPIEKTNQGATTADYSGVPQNVTFDSGDTQKSFVFTAETDTDDDHGESVRLSFDTMPDARVSEGSPSEAMVTIRQDSTPSTADCNSAIWCADLEFRSESPPGEMWFLGSTFVDSQFHYGGVTYRFGHISVAPYGHNIPINGQPNPPWAIPERTKFYFSLHNMNASGYDLDRFRVPNDDWMDWTLHISTTKNGETLTAVLPFSEARFGGGQSEWRWYGSDLEALRAAWTEGQVYKLKIVEDPRSQRTPKVLGPPLYLKVTPYTNHTLGVWWKMPENRVDRAPPNTTYKVQWKEASDSWDNPADVSEETDSPSPATNEILSHSIRGLTGGAEYHVRVIATNTVGDSEPSEVVSRTPTPLPATGQNIAANSPAKGAPSIEGTSEVGRTLSAVTTDITVVFSYQWLADDVEISGADGATYILTSDDLGKAINVRVDFTDNAGNEESLTSAPTAAVTAAEDLELQSATVDGSTLTLTYNETLDTGVTLPASAFVVNVNEASRSIMGAGVGGSSVLLLLSPAVVAGDTVNVDYTKPSGSDVIKDTQGRQADSSTGQAVTNNTAPAETERSDPAQTPGSPNSLKVVRHESGKLMATWAAPDSGSDPTGFTLQWKEAGDGWETQDSVSPGRCEGHLPPHHGADRRGGVRRAGYRIQG